MINKSQVGNRISALRKTKNLSQTLFAEKLGISSQAVSKWETGQALPDIEILLNISRITQVSINEILEGDNIIYRIANRPYEMKDIAYFVAEEERDYNIEWAKENVSAGWTKRNWEAQKKTFASRRHISKKIIDHGGCILELGTGPGGGYMPCILFEKTDANIIISDLSPTVVREWKKVLESELNPPYVSYAALDNCDLPFNDSSIDVISSGGGFGNTEGDKYKALDEIYRVLKPGGLYISGDGYVTQETFKSLPEHAQKALLEKFPDIFNSFYDASVMAGFKTINNEITGLWSNKDDESNLADLSRELGVEVIFSGYLRCCIK